MIKGKTIRSFTIPVAGSPSGRTAPASAQRAAGAPLPDNPIKKSWCIYSDLSGCTQVATGDGGFATEAEANARLIERLEGHVCELKEKLGKARRRRNAIAKTQAYLAAGGGRQ